MKLLAISTFLMIVPSILSVNVFLDNLKPEEAQQYLAQHDLGVKYAPKLGEIPLAQSRNHYGRYYQGREITNPGDYVEEHYLANQYHGQDGLGKARFGYTDWNQGRAEAIEGPGHVRGTYKYVDPTGKDFVAHYWSDGRGFHQEDNRPKVVLEPVTDTPEVQRARDKHFQKWNEIAAEHRASHGAYNNYNNDNGSDDGQYKERHYEQTGPPHGFYYNFDYPVQLLRKIKDSSEYNSQYASQQYGNYGSSPYGAQQYNNNDYNKYFQSKHKRSAVEEASPEVKDVPQDGPPSPPKAATDEAAPHINPEVLRNLAG